MKYIKAISTMIGSLLGFLFGNLDGFMITLIVFVIFDYITGVASAIINNDLSSEIGFKGIIKKIIIFIVVSVANLIDAKVIQRGGVLRTATIFFYLSNEGVSILENIAKCNIPLPKKLLNILKQLKENNDECDSDRRKDE